MGLKRKSKRKAGSAYRATKVILHPLFDGVYHDIALVSLSETVKFSSKISPICLPPSEEVNDYGHTVISFNMTCATVISLQLISLCLRLMLQDGVYRPIQNVLPITGALSRERDACSHSITMDQIILGAVTVLHPLRRLKYAGSFKVGNRIENFRAHKVER